MRPLFPDIRIADPHIPDPVDWPDLKFHGYLLLREQGNLLFNRVEHAADHDDIATLGGVSRHYIAHGHEASPGMGVVKARFGNTLLAHSAARGDIAPHAGLDQALQGGERFPDGVEVIRTPGHTASNVAFKVRSRRGETYLFVGDTLFPVRGTWQALVFEDEGGDKAQLQRSLALLAEHEPDVVFFSATLPDAGFHRFTPGEWRAALDEASRSLA